MEIQRVFSFQLQSPKAMNIKCLAGLLTYSPLFCLPIRRRIVTKNKHRLKSLQLRDSHRITLCSLLTPKAIGDQSDAKVTVIYVV